MSKSKFISFIADTFMLSVASKVAQLVSGTDGHTSKTYWQTIKNLLISQDLI